MIAFRLEPLLKYRKLQEEVLEKALAEIRMQMEREREKLAEYRNRRKTAVLSFQQRQCGNSLDGDSARVYVDYLARLEDDIRQQRDQIEKVRQQVDKKRLELQEAARNRKMIDKLKEKQRRRDTETHQHQERIFFDQVATNTFIRKGGPDE
jgi:flagellar FliJ protein